MERSAIRNVSIQTTRTARCSVVGDPQVAPTVWVCAHGYAQLARFVARQFEPLASPQRAFVVPEALSRFYVTGMSGRAGASWMTSDGRQSEIDDYLAYMRTIRARIIGDQAAVVLFGFSQGTATVSRWVAYDAVQPTALVLWAGAMANDLTEEGLARVRRVPVRLMVAGDNDEYLDEERIAAEIRRANELDIKFDVVRFSGGHAIIDDILRDVVGRVERAVAED